MREQVDKGIRRAFRRFSAKYKTAGNRWAWNIDQLVNADIKKQEYIQEISMRPLETATTRNVIAGLISQFIGFLLLRVWSSCF